MKKQAIKATAFLLLLSATATAADIRPVISAMDMARSDNEEQALYVSYTVDRPAMSVPTNTEVILTPVVRFAGDSIELQPVILAGRSAYLAHQRNHNLPAGTDIVRAKGEALTRTAKLAWRPEMKQSVLTFRAETIGCRCKEEGAGSLPDMLAMDFTPKMFDLIIPSAQLTAMEQKVDEIVKTRSLSKKAYVNFKVNSTTLLPDYKTNPRELKAIMATIDSVRSDKDLSVETVLIHGYASPEGSYENNRRLAEGRTNSLKNYVDKNYGFGTKLHTASTAEDWAGLKEWVTASNLPDRQGLLEIIDSNLQPDAKDAQMKAKYPAEYATLLAQAYPTLRRTDYRIDYVVKTFTDPKTIAVLIETAPDKLSAEEVILLARSYDEGSTERISTMAKAADLFPDNQVAQLYGAFLALENKDLERAEKLLNRGGTSPVADYARGVLLHYKGENTEALPYLKKASAAGIEGAKEAQEVVENHLR